MPLSTARPLSVLLAAFLLGTSFPLRAQQPGPAPAHCLLRPLDPARRAEQAALVVEGEVLSAEGFWDAGHRRIFTAHRVRVFGLFKGAAGAEITLLTEGGTVGDDRQELTNTLRLAVGDQGIWFLTPAPWATAGRAAWAAYGSQQGFIRYDLVTGTATEPFATYPRIDAGFYAAVSRHTGQVRRPVAPNPVLTATLAHLGTAAKGQAPVIGLLSPLTLPAGTGAVLTISGSGFGAAQGPGAVEFRNADDGGNSYIRPQPADYVSWSDTRIQVRVPSFGTAGNPAGTGAVRVTTADQLQALSLQTLTIPYALSNVQDRGSKTVVRPRHTNANGSGGLSFRLEADFAANAPAAQIFGRDLLQVWRCQTGINWTLGANRTAHGAADDGECSVGFDRGAELPVNVLGRTTTYYRGCFGPRGEIGFQVKEVDMQFDDGASFFFGPGTPGTGQYDFESVVTHELGHAQQLSHVVLARAVMHFGIAARQVKQTLSADDLSGGRLVLRTRSFAAALCGLPPMLPAPLTALAARRLGSGTELTWATQDECFVQSFVVERSADTTAWQPAGTLPAGAGPAYRFVDAQPLPGLSYYRLRLRRPDGTLDAAAPLPVTGEEATGLVVFPNPVRRGLLRLQYLATAQGVLAVDLYDEIGRFYRSQALDVQPGLNVLSLGLDALPPGFYLLRWADQAGHTGTTRFIKEQ